MNLKIESKISLSITFIQRFVTQSKLPLIFTKTLSFPRKTAKLNTDNYFCKKLHLSCFTVSWISLRLSSLDTSLFFLLFFPLWITEFRSSRSKISFKIGVLKNFAIFTGKHLCSSLFVIKLPVCKSANLLKRDSNTSVFQLILLNF